MTRSRASRILHNDALASGTRLRTLDFVRFARSQPRVRVTFCSHGLGTKSSYDAFAWPTRTRGWPFMQLTRTRRACVRVTNFVLLAHFLPQASLTLCPDTFYIDFSGHASAWMTRSREVAKIMNDAVM
uniref:Uncharacterized protein n=1 Tax=Arachis hypogaea TaxID=3818 RepID=G0Y6U3_ARAHY|nr:unknown [Arachis hypogaea]